MPEYLVIILVSVIVPLIALAVGFWLGEKAAAKRILLLRDKFEKIVHKTEALEKAVSGGISSGRKKFQYNRTRIVKVFSDEMLDIADRLEVIKNKLNSPRPYTEHRQIQIKTSDAPVKKTDPSDQHVYNPHPNQALFSTVQKPDKFNQTNPRLDDRSPVQQIVELYNRGVDHRPGRELFREKYSMRRLGNNKAVEQRLGEAAEPEFRELDNGNLLAVSGSDNSYFVLPRFDTTLNSSVYNEGGFGFAFDCPEYNDESAYSVIYVKRPAIFRQEGDDWKVIDKGELILHQ